MRPPDLSCRVKEGGQTYRYADPCLSASLCQHGEGAMKHSYGSLLDLIQTTGLRPFVFQGVRLAGMHLDERSPMLPR
jgi:hypothetical protein